MSPKRPAYTEGSYYHFYNRGAHRRQIFNEDDNYFFLLGKMKETCRKYDIVPIAYCLLPNHYHFCVQQRSQHPARLLPQSIFNSYSKAYNKRYGHSGTLFEGPYKVRHVDSDEYLRQLCRYIHANPVTHGIVQRPEKWPYSNYLEWLDRRGGTLVDRQFVKEMFPGGPDEYQEFVWDYLLMRQMPEGFSFLDDV